MKIKSIISKFKPKKSVSDNISYPNFCLEASKNKNVFETFRSHIIYKNILEHVEGKLALEYFSLIKSKYKLTNNEIYSRVKILNSIGSPELIKIDEVIPELSATGLRYLYTGLEIKAFLDQNNLSSSKIVELGCGYGGQSLILNDLIRIESYTYIDLPQVNPLIKQFLNNFEFSFNTNFETINTINTSNSNRIDLFISNYSFSELPGSLQKKVLKKIIRNSKAGYMIINSDNFSKEYEFMKKDEYRTISNTYNIYDENPQSSSKKVNFVFEYIN
jgi:hypothetical protein